MAETKTFQKTIKEKAGAKSIKMLPARPISNLQNRAEQIVYSPFLDSLLVQPGSVRDCAGTLFTHTYLVI